MKYYLLRIIDFFWVIVLLPSAIIMRITRKLGVGRLPITDLLLNYVGVFPIVSHYYEPQFDGKFDYPLDQKRSLTGINWNIEEQLELLSNMRFADEFVELYSSAYLNHGFAFNNETFESGDAEYWYQLIRLKKPKRIFEIGSGNSTRLAILAIEQNKREDSTYQCRHVCIEPFEMPWLEATNVELIRKKVESLNCNFFNDLSKDDILFIDSSHIIRPQGDVLFEYLELLPILQHGVIVHIHDIFSPRNYLSQFLIHDRRFWNEQYLVEAFLTQNSNWRIIGALNLLKNSYYDQLKKVAPYLNINREPGSLYIQCIK